MRILWFGRYEPKRVLVSAVQARRPRPDDEIALALSSLPLYRVVLTRAPRESDASPASARALVSMVGAERAERIMLDAKRFGGAPVAICPRELAEHYCDELARRALPCVIEPA